MKDNLSWITNLPFIQDGTKVPITLCYHRNKVKPDNRNPVLVHVYGKDLGNI